MKRIILFLLLLLQTTAHAQSSNGILFQRYYITGSLRLGAGARDIYADDAAWLQLGGEGVTTKGIIFPRVTISTFANPNNKKALFVYGEEDSTLYCIDGTVKYKYLSQKDSNYIKALISSGDVLTFDGHNSAYYLSRANHIGMQAISTISGLQSALNSKTLQTVTTTGDSTINALSTGRLNITNRNYNPKYFLGLGDSFTAGAGATATTNGYAYRLAQYFGLTFVNYAISGGGGYTMMKYAHLHVNPGHSTLVLQLSGLNDMRRRMTINQTTFGYPEDERFVFNSNYTTASNSWMANAEQAGNSANVTRSGTFSTMSVIPYAGKSANAALTTTANDTLKYVSSDTTPVAICLLGGDGVNTTYAPYAIYKNSTLIRSGTTNGKAPNSNENGLYDNRRDPFTEVVKLNVVGDTIKIVSLASGADDSLIIDYIGNWVKPENAIPVIRYGLVKGDSSHASVDSLTAFNVRFDSLFATLAPYPVFNVPTTYYNAHYYDGTPSFINADRLHPSDRGHIVLDSLGKSVVNYYLKPKAALSVASTTSAGDLLQMSVGDTVKYKIDRSGTMYSSGGLYVAGEKGSGYNYRPDSFGVDRYIFTGTAGKITMRNDSMLYLHAVSGSANAVITWTRQLTVKDDVVFLPHNASLGINNGTSVFSHGGSAFREKYGYASTYFDFADGTNGTEAVMGYTPNNSTLSTCYFGMSITNTGQWAVNANTNTYNNAMFSIYGKNTKPALRIDGANNTAATNIVEVTPTANGTDKTFLINSGGHTSLDNQTFSKGTLVTTTNNTTTTVFTLAIPTAGRLRIWADVKGKSGTDDCWFVKSALVENNSGTLTVNNLIDLQTAFTEGVTAGATVTITASGTNALVRVTGLTATTIDWLPNIKYILD